MMEVWPSILSPILIEMISVLGLYVIANSGRLSAGHAALFGIGGYVGGVSSVILALPPVLSLVLAVIGAAAVGAVFALVADRLSAWFFAITTLALNIMLISLAGTFDFLGGATGLYGIPLVFSFAEIVSIVLAAIAYVVWLDSTRFGREMRAVRDSPLAAQSLGIDPRRTRLIAFAIGSGMAGLGGALWGHYVGLFRPSDMSLDRSLLYLIYLSIGGQSVWLGPVVGTLLLGLLPEFLRFSNQYRLAVFGLLLTVVMVFRPAGLLVPRSGRPRAARDRLLRLIPFRVAGR